MDNSSIELFIYNITLYYIPILCQKYSVRVCVRGPYSEARTLPSHVRCVKDSQSSLPGIFLCNYVYHEYFLRLQKQVQVWSQLVLHSATDNDLRSTRTVNWLLLSQWMQFMFWCHAISSLQGFSLANLFSQSKLQSLRPEQSYQSYYT